MWKQSALFDCVEEALARLCGGEDLKSPRQFQHLTAGASATDCVADRDDENLRPDRFIVSYAGPARYTCAEK